MAKKNKDQTPGPPPPATPATPTGSAAAITRPTSEAADPSAPSRDDEGLVAQVGETLAASVRTAQSLLPTSRVPVYLAGTALLVAGLIDPPVALGAGLAYEALRRWQPTPIRGPAAARVTGP